MPLVSVGVGVDEKFAVSESHLGLQKSYLSCESLSIHHTSHTQLSEVCVCVCVGIWGYVILTSHQV